MRKKISLLLAFAVCFGLLTGCSRDEEKRTASEDAPARAEPSVSAEPTRYRAQYCAVTDERLTSALQNAALCGDDLFCTALGVLEDRTPEGVKPEWKEQYDSVQSYQQDDLPNYFFYGFTAPEYEG